MAYNEKSIIEHFFKRYTTPGKYTKLGIGDDAAIFSVPPDQQVVTSIDTVVSGIHFSDQTVAKSIGHKSLAVSLSDMAAMGAWPFSVLLSLTMPNIDENWLSAFSRGFFSLANQHGVTLIGGDLTRGPLSVSTVVNGFIPCGQAITRDGARVKDLIYVSGDLGDAGLALQSLNAGRSVADGPLKRLNYPQPRVNLGIALRNIATSAIDISDGLYADLEKLIHLSQVGAIINAEQLPLSSQMLQACPERQAWEYALTAGDDYELCFTVPQEKAPLLKQISNKLAVPCHRIGEIVSDSQLAIMGYNNELINMTLQKGFDHFES